MFFISLSLPLQLFDRPSLCWQCHRKLLCAVWAYPLCCIYVGKFCSMDFVIMLSLFCFSPILHSPFLSPPLCCPLSVSLSLSGNKEKCWKFMLAHKKCWKWIHLHWDRDGNGNGKGTTKVKEGGRGGEGEREQEMGVGMEMETLLPAGLAWLRENYCGRRNGQKDNTRSWPSWSMPPSQDWGEGEAGWQAGGRGRGEASSSCIP